jgi:hypothetical protein
MTQEEITRLLEDASRVESIVNRVRETMPEVAWPNVYSEALWFGNGAENLIQHHNGVIVQYGDEPPFCANFVTEQYKIVPHEVIMHYLMDEVNTNWAGKWGTPVFKAALYDNGTKAYMQASFPEMTMDKKALRVGKDIIEPWVGFKNSYDSQIQLTGTGGGKVLRCSNGMMGTKTLMMFRKKHRQDLTMDVMVQRLAAAMQTMEQEHEMWKMWAKLQIEKAQAEEILQALPISEKQTEKILALPETGTGLTLESIFTSGKPVTAWKMNSILTQWLTHEVKESAGRREREEEFAFVLARNFDHLKKN